MTHRRELLMWLAVVCALGFVLLAAVQSSNPVTSMDVAAEVGEEPQAADFGGPGDPDLEYGSDDIPDVYKQAADAQYKPVSFQEYKVQQNDNLWKIAKKFGGNADFWYTLLSVNELSNANALKVGQTVRVPDAPGILHTVKSGETLEDIALRYDVSMQQIAGTNGLSDPSQIVARTPLFIPNARITLSDQRRLEAQGNVPLQFAWPTKTHRLTSSFGYRKHPVTRRRTFHQGTDIGCGHGAPVYASAAGNVTFAGRMGGYGNLVVIRHPRGFETRYAHNSRLKVRKGQSVSQGQQIALSGNTGLTNGPHLHFEIRKSGKAQNPVKYLR